MHDRVKDISMDYLLILAIAVFTIVLLASVDLVLGTKKMKNLNQVTPLQETDPPGVSLIVPACNEAEKIEPAIISLLQQNYTNLEVLAINDRSTDDTGPILQRLQSQYPSLRVFHIDSLPPGWMGKAHALQFGADRAKGDFLLFTDADITMDKTTLSRAMAYIGKSGIDHLALVFKNVSPGWLLNSLILDAGVGLLQVFRPWLAKKAKSRYFIGIGAFNLVRKDVYHEVGGHESIKMHPIDDIMLGKIIKRNGHRQECLLGHDLITVPWYDSVAQMINGLMKNILAIINFRFTLVPIALVAMFVINILPFWGIFFCKGATQFFFSITVLLRLTIYYNGTRLLRISPWCSLGTLISPYITMFMVVKATWLNIRDKGVYWRGTHYPLAELKKNESLLF